MELRNLICEAALMEFVVLGRNPPNFIRQHAGKIEVNGNVAKNTSFAEIFCTKPIFTGTNFKFY